MKNTINKENILKKYLESYLALKKFNDENEELFYKLKELEYEFKANENWLKNNLNIGDKLILDNKYLLRFFVIKRNYLNSKNVKEFEPEIYNNYVEKKIIKKITLKKL